MIIIKQFMKFCVPFLPFILVSCASPKTYHHAMDSWDGVPVQFLAQQWGRPTEISTLANGNTYYLYTEVTRRSIEGCKKGIARPGQEGNNKVFLNQPLHAGECPYTIMYWCKTGFEINAQGVIVNVVSYGDNCVVSESGKVRLLAGE